MLPSNPCLIHPGWMNFNYPISLHPFRSYLDKTISLHLNKGRKVRGTLRGYDQFMNIVLGDAVEEVPGSEQSKIGMVVRPQLVRATLLI